MKNTLLFLFIAISLNAAAQQSLNNKLKPEAWYKFNNTWINLDSFEKADLKADTLKTFKDLSIYSLRLKAPLWFGTYPGEVVLKNKMFQLLNKNIFITNYTPGTDMGLYNSNASPKNTDGTSQNFLLPTSHVAVHIQRLEKNPVYAIKVYDEKGAVKYTFSLAHTMIENENGGFTYYPFLNFFDYSDEHLIFTSDNKAYPQTYLLDLKTGEQTAYNYSVAGIIRSADEKKIIGFIEINEEKGTFNVNSDEKTWSAPLRSKFYDEAESLVSDSILVVASYPKIATGSALSAYNFYTGKLLWNAEVEQINADHSQYYNRVLLSKYKDKVIMEGIEANGKYLQVFDMASGRRLFSLKSE